MRTMANPTRTAGRPRKGKTKAHSSRNKPFQKKTLSSHRKERKQAAEIKEGQNKGPQHVEDGFYEVQKIVGERKLPGRKKEYLVRWKGIPPSGDTWEPAGNLCDTAYRDAIRFSREQAAMKKKLKEAEASLGLQAQVSKVEDVIFSPICPIKENTNCSNNADTTLSKDDAWDDELAYLDIERIDVFDSDAARRVKEARINGIPIVLVGHHGWAQFAVRWLKNPMSSEPLNCEDKLDLSKSYEIDVGKMIEDIGDEPVPVLKKNYNEYKPIQDKISVSAFLKNCWPSPGSSVPVNKNLYLHQWQFPLSDTAFGKLCGQGKSFPLPNDILGEDLLKLWLDNKENPYQYIFMGMDRTMSKLHKDNGGMDISIAPIVGEKQCVLVHRSDGETCLYNLDAKLEDVNLNKYPMMRFARVWKTTIRPGEILWMPQGTYHQCCNTTPCLSYSR